MMQQSPSQLLTSRNALALCFSDFVRVCWFPCVYLWYLFLTTCGCTFLFVFVLPRLAIYTILAGKFGDLIVILGICCSTFVNINMGTSGRDCLTPEGQTEYMSVALANCMVSRTGLRNICVFYKKLFPSRSPPCRCVLLALLIRCCGGCFFVRKPGELFDQLPLQVSMVGQTVEEKGSSCASTILWQVFYFYSNSYSNFVNYAMLKEPFSMLELSCTAVAFGWSTSKANPRNGLGCGAAHGLWLYLVGMVNWLAPPRKVKSAPPRSTLIKKESVDTLHLQSWKKHRFLLT